MKYIVVILSVVASIRGLPQGNRIWGGQNATSGQFPYIVALNDLNQYCGGAIIAPNWILTTAQCLFRISPTASIYVGDHINHANGTSYRIIDTIVHEGFDEWTYQDDIGLIKLETNLEFSDTVRAIEFSENVAENTTCTIAGWGATEDETFIDNLRFVEEMTIGMDLCQNMSVGYLYDRYLGPEQMCALAPVGLGGCFSDAGGPLVCGGRLAGINSYIVGYACGAGLPSVYTSISVYLNWILTVIQP